jgi:hypothetical protein
MDYIVIGGPPPFVRHSEDSSIMANSGPGSDTTCKNYGHHLSPHWYDIVHFGPKPSWICSWAIPKRPHTNGDICPSLYTHDPPHF